MRLLMLNNEFPPLGGGTGTVNREILKQFAQQPGLQIDLITSALGQTPDVEQFADNIHIHKVPVNNQNIHHSSNRELLTYAARALPLAIRLHRTAPYDFCFAWSAVPAGGVALALRYTVGLRYLVRVCGPDIPGFEQRYRWLYPVLTPIIRAIWRGAETVVAKCQGEADMIRDIDDCVDISLVPNGVDLATFDAEEHTRSAGTPLRILCVARLIKRKGQHHLIEAVKRLTDDGVPVTLRLIGAGDAEDEYRELVRSFDIVDRVEFAGYVPRARIADEYAGADVFVLPSYNEGMSVATLEAMAAGLPVVVTDTPGMAELVDDGGNGLTFAWGDIATLERHLRRLASDRELIREMGWASRERAERFSWDRIANQYSHLFDMLQTAELATSHIETIDSHYEPS